MFVSQIFDEASEVLGTTDQSRVFKKLTRAVAALMQSGHWFHEVQQMDVCTGWDGETITLPKDVEVPLAVNVDGSPLYFRSRWFQYHINKGGMFNSVNWCWDDRGFASSFVDIRQPSELIAVAESDNDAGKTIRILGTDDGNRPLLGQLSDGTGVDGLIIPIHSRSDYASGMISPDGMKIQERTAAISPFNSFVSATPHNLSSGEGLVVTDISSLPSPLISGSLYYAGVLDQFTIQLYSDPLYAKSGEYPIALQSISGTGTLTMTDARPSEVVTSVRMGSVPGVTITQANEVVFSQNGTNPLPSPLLTGSTYFANQLDSLDLQIFTNLTDANNSTNPVYLSGATTPFFAQIRKAISPQTTLVFAVNPYYSQGDVIQASTTGGTLPLPLIAGQNYYVGPITQPSGSNPNWSLTIHANSSDAASGINPISFTTAGTGTFSIVKLIPATAIPGQISNIAAPGFTVSTPGGSGGGGSCVVVGGVTGVNITAGGSGYTTVPSVVFSAPPPPPVGTTQTTRTATGYALIAVNASVAVVAGIVITDGGLGYTTAPTVSFSGGSGSGATATAIITTSFLSSVSLTAVGSGYTSAPYVQVIGGGGNGATVTASISAGAITGFTVITEGTGYTTAPTITVTPSTGAFVQFSTNGTLPSPLVEGTAYLVGAPLSGSTFTLLNTDFTPVNITGSGSGSFYLALARTFSVGFNNVWSGDFSGVTTGQGVYFGTDYLIPITSPAIDNGITQFYVDVISSTTALFYQTSAQSIAHTSAGLITTTALGVGQAYFAVQVSATGVPYGSTIQPSNVQYLTNGETVQFSISSGGTLPSPIVASTNYTIQVNGQYVSIYNGSSQVILTSIPSGSLDMNIIRSFTPVPSNSIIANDFPFNTGTPLIARSNTGDILDPNIIAGTTYYSRRVDSNTLQLFGTMAQSINLSSNTGLISFSTIGNTASSTFIIDVTLPPVLVKTIMGIDKPVTTGFVSLYAYDYGRSNDLALIGQYHPSETNPKYRRIRIGKKSAWVRILYRVKEPNITSIYDFIPLEQTSAILAALRAIDLEDKQFIDAAAKNWQLALTYLKNQERSLADHAMMPPQIENLINFDGDEPIMM